MTESLDTKVTHLGNGLYGCRIIDVATNQPIVELRVAKHLISDAIYDMLRTLTKGGQDSDMAYASRHRGKGKCVDAQYIWYSRGVAQSG